MWLSDVSLKRPIAMSVVLIILMLLGALAVRQIGIDVVPRVDVPYITITVPWPGASPEEIETSLGQKIEEAVVQVDGLKHVTTTCAQHFCSVMLEFELGRDVDKLATDVREKIDLIRNDFPKDAKAPQIVKYDVNASPVVTFALTGSKDPNSLYDWADRSLKNRFSTLPGVSGVELVGGERRDVVVHVDRSKLAASGLTLGEVVEAVAKGSVKIPAGELVDNARARSVLFDASAKTPTDLGTIEVGHIKGTRLLLRDLAHIDWGAIEPTTRALFAGQTAVAFSISKKGEANGVAVVKAIRRAFEQEAQRLPDGLKLVWIRDSGAFTQASVDDGLWTVLEGMLLTACVLILFLADWRSACVAFLSIPCSILISLVVFPFFGYTMNLVTMCALGISVGMLVDNSLVILENISKELTLHPPRSASERLHTIAQATHAVALAVAAGSLTNIVVFLPLTLMKTLAGHFFIPFGIVVVASSLASLFVSFTLTPILSKCFANRGEALNRLLRFLLIPWSLFYSWCEKLYASSLQLVTRFPRTFIFICTALTCLGFAWCVPRIEADFIPKFDQGEMTVRLEFPSDVSLEKSSARAQEIATRLSHVRDQTGHPLVKLALVKVGRTMGMMGQVGRGVHLAEIILRTTDKNERRDSLEQILAAVRQTLATEHDVDAQVMSPSPVGGTSQSSQLEILGDDLTVLSTVGQACVKEIAQEKSITDVSHTIRPEHAHVRLRPKRQVLQDLGVKPDMLGLTLRAALTGLTPATFTQGDQSYEVRVRLENGRNETVFNALHFPTPDARLIPLDALLSSTQDVTRVQIVRCDCRRAQLIYANNAAGYGLGTTLSREREIVSRHLPPTYEMKFGGMAEYMEETVKEFGLVTGLAILLAYLLLCALMESWIQPFAILFTIPFSYLGMFLACVLTRTTLSVFGLLAGVMLVGVVVNAAILFVDAFNQIQRAHATPAQEAVTRAMKEKFRPILMSVVTSLVGMLPMALGTGLGGELRASMGVGAFGGMFISTLISLYFVPALFACSHAGQSHTLRSDR